MIREEAIKHLTSLRIHSQNRQLGKDIEALDKAIDALEQTRWIPCSERLPDKNDICLVTIKTKHNKNLSAVVQTSMWVEGETFNPYAYEDGEVIAWMPLPEPYEEVEE